MSRALLSSAKLAISWARLKESSIDLLFRANSPLGPGFYAALLPGSTLRVAILSAYSLLLGSVERLGVREKIPDDPVAVWGG